MRQTKLKKAASLALSLCVAAAAMSVSTAPSSAAPIRNISAMSSLQNGMVHDVRWRRYHRHHHHHHGGAVAAGVLGGLAFGAMLGAAAAAPPPPPPVYYRPYYAADDDWLAYCASKYRSFDPRSGTYLGYDGLRHPCR